MGGSVIKAIRDEPGVDEIVALDIRPERVRQLRDELGVTATDSLAAVLDDPEVKLVFVTASNAAHAPLTLGRAGGRQGGDVREADRHDAGRRGACRAHGRGEGRVPPDRLRTAVFEALHAGEKLDRPGASWPYKKASTVRWRSGSPVTVNPFPMGHVSSTGAATRV